MLSRKLVEEVPSRLRSVESLISGTALEGDTTPIAPETVLNELRCLRDWLRDIHQLAKVEAEIQTALPAPGGVFVGCTSENNGGAGFGPGGTHIGSVSRGNTGTGFEGR
jgi:hypothetical protein